MKSVGRTEVGGWEGKWGRYLAGFVLCDFVLRMFLAVFALAVGAAGFGYVDLDERVCQIMIDCNMISWRDLER